MNGRLPAWCKYFALFGLACLTPARLACAEGGPPMITDDPDTPGNGKWEINIGLIEERDPQSKTFELPQFDINYGLGDHIELTSEAGPLIVDDNYAPYRGQHLGFSNSLLGAKWRFLDEEKSGIAISTYPQLQFNTPPGSIERGVVESGTNFYLPFEFGKTFGKFSVAAEFGYNFLQHQPDQWQYGIVGSYSITEKLQFLAETRVNSETNFHFNDVILNAGAIYEFNEHYALLVSAGRSLRDTNQSSTLLVYLGVRLNF